MRSWLINERYRLWREHLAPARSRIYLAEDLRRPGLWAVKIWTTNSATGSREIPLAALHALDHPFLAPLSGAGRISSLSPERRNSADRSRVGGDDRGDQVGDDLGELPEGPNRSSR